MRIGITGARGYVGGALAAAAQAHGHEVVAFTRSPCGELPWEAYELGAEPPAAVLAQLDVLVHAAYDLSLTSAAEIERVNVEGTARLIAACKQAGTRVCLISSMSAYAGTTQLYGGAKLRSEHAVRAAGGVAVRLGLVYGGQNGGMIGALQKIAALPLIPIFGARSHQFLVHVDDMTAALLALIEAGEGSGEVVGLAHPVPVSFGDVIVRIAAARGRRVRLLPIPWQPVYAAMRAAEALGLKLPVRADSVLGLVRPAAEVPGARLWERLGVQIPAFDAARI